MLKGILSISGKPGLYKMLSQGKNTIIVESLTDGKRMPAHSYTKIIALEDIAIFTDQEDVPLADVLKNVYEKENGGACINPKKASSDELKAYFEEILPDYDRDRVYVSDMKKLFTWYETLREHNLLNFTEDEEGADETSEETKDDAPKQDNAEA